MPSWAAWIGQKNSVIAKNKPNPSNHCPKGWGTSASISFAWSARNAFSIVSSTGPSSAPLAFV